MEEFLGVKYVMVDSENFEEYLIFIGVGYIARKAALTLRPTHILILNENGTYTFYFNSRLVNSSVTFVSGVEFDEVKPDGVKVEVSWGVRVLYNNSRDPNQLHLLVVQAANQQTRLSLPTNPHWARVVGDGPNVYIIAGGQYPAVNVKSVITIEGNKMIHIQREENGRTSKHVREFYQDKMVATTTAEGLNMIVKRYFEAVR